MTREELEQEKFLKRLDIRISAINSLLATHEKYIISSTGIKKTELDKHIKAIDNSQRMIMDFINNTDKEIIEFFDKYRKEIEESEDNNAKNQG